MFEYPLIPAIMATSPIGDLVGSSHQHVCHEHKESCKDLNQVQQIDRPVNCEALRGRCERLEALLESAWWRINQLQQEKFMAEMALQTCEGNQCRQRCEHSIETPERPIVVEAYEHPRQCVIHQTTLIIESMLDILA